MFELNEIEKRVLKESLTEWIKSVTDLREACAKGNVDEEDINYFKYVATINEGYLLGSLDTISDLHGVDFIHQLPNALYDGKLFVAVIKNLGTDEEVCLGEFEI